MLKCYVELTWTESFQLLYVALTTSASDDWFVEYIKITSKRESKTWVANYNMWIKKSKYKVHGNYGPLCEIVTAGLEIQKRGWIVLLCRQHGRAITHLCGLSDVAGFDQNCLRQGRREEHRDWGHHESMAWRATEAETFYFLFMLWSMRMRTDNAMEVHFGLRLLDRATDHAYCHNYPGVNQARELRHLQCWSSN